MAFCKYCGSNVPDGQVCTCPQAQAAAQAAAQPVQAAPQAAPQAAAAQAVVTDAAKSIKPYLTEFFTNPAMAIRRVVEQDNMTMAIVLTVIRALAAGLAVYGLLRKVCAMAMSAATAAMGAFGGGMAGMMGTSIKAPLVGGILWGAVIGVLGLVLFTVMVFVLTKITKTEISIKACFEASAANSVLTSALLLLSFICSFLHLGLCIGLLALSCLAWMITGVLTAQMLNQDNVSGKFWLSYVIGAVLVIVVGYYVMPGLFLKAAGGIAVTAAGVTTTMQTAIDAAKAGIAAMGGVSGLLTEMLGDLF